MGLARKPWPVQVADERMLAVFDSGIIRYILRMWRRDCVPTVGLASIWAALVWSRRETSRCKADQLKVFATTVKADLEPLSEP